MGVNRNTFIVKKYLINKRDVHIRIVTVHSIPEYILCDKMRYTKISY